MFDQRHIDHQMNEKIRPRAFNPSVNAQFVTFSSMVICLQHYTVTISLQQLLIHNIINKAAGILLFRLYLSEGFRIQRKFPFSVLFRAENIKILIIRVVICSWPERLMILVSFE